MLPAQIVKYFTLFYVCLQRTGRLSLQVCFSCVAYKTLQCAVPLLVLMEMYEYIKTGHYNSPFHSVCPFTAG